MIAPSKVHHSDTRYTDLTVLEARLGLRLAGHLTLATETLPHDVGERLRFAREQALARARAASAQPPTAVGMTAAGALILGTVGSWLQRAASVLPLVLLVGGLMMIQQMSLRERVLAAAEIDTQLLADDLPPTAYSDPGFAEFVRTDPQP